MKKNSIQLGLILACLALTCSLKAQQKPLFPTQPQFKNHTPPDYLFPKTPDSVGLQNRDWRSFLLQNGSQQPNFQHNSLLKNNEPQNRDLLFRPTQDGFPQVRTLLYDPAKDKPQVILLGEPALR
jgi:hypothetical protein